MLTTSYPNPSLSFLIFCDSSRQDNLHQVLRFIIKRDYKLIDRAEFIVVCQDQIQKPTILPIKLINLKMSYFNKPIMVNTAVKSASSDVIVILDGDRILPNEYFSRSLASFRQGRIFCPLNLYKLDKPYSDKEIEDRQYKRVEDFRSPEVIPGRKNAFSGMVMMGKSDYWLAGGMDESLVGYGCSDTDFTMTCLKQGLEIVYTEDEELHLWHKVNMSYEDFFSTNLKSACRFCRKWNVQVPDMFKSKIKNNLIM